MAIYNITSQQLKGAGILNSFEIPGSGAFPNQYSVNLDGTDDEIIATLSNGDNIIRFSKTISFWIKFDEWDFDGMVLAIKGTRAADYFSVRKYSSGEIGFGCRGAPAHGKVSDSTKWDAESTLENWTHMLVTRQTAGTGRGEVVKIFINGVDVTGGGATINQGNTNEFKIGQIGNIGYYGSHLKGKVDEFAVFEGHLTSSANIDAIYNGGIPSDLTDLNPLVWYRMGDIVAASGSNIPDQGSLGEGDLVLQNDAAFVEDVPS